MLHSAAHWLHIHNEFGLSKQMQDEPFARHPVATFEVNLFTAAEFGAFIPWLVINKRPLSALLHPNCEDGDAVRDHTQRATWLGEKIVLDVGMSRDVGGKRAQGADSD